jgi:hypothetical protein
MKLVIKQGSIEAIVQEIADLKQANKDKLHAMKEAILMAKHTLVDMKKWKKAGGKNDKAEYEEMIENRREVIKQLESNYANFRDSLPKYDKVPVSICAPGGSVIIDWNLLQQVLRTLKGWEIEYKASYRALTISYSNHKSYPNQYGDYEIYPTGPQYEQFKQIPDVDAIEN